MASISKLEYLKRYTDPSSSSDVKKKKKKKIKISSQHSRIKILDCDIKFKDESKNILSDNGEFDLKEEKPQVFASDGKTLITEDYEKKELEKSRKWAPLKTDTNGTNKSLQQKTSYLGDLSDSDASPPRKQRRKRHDSTDSDISPQRRKLHDSSNSDLSPPRTSTGIKPSKEMRHDSSDSDLSPSRVPNISTDRYRLANDNGGRKTRKEEPPEIIKQGNKKAGLKSSADVKLENRKLSRDREALISQMDSGKSAKTIYRDRKSGKKIDLKFEKMKQVEKEKQVAKDKEHFAKWGKGIAQENEYKEKLKSDVYEMSKPLSRYRDDNDLDQMLKDRDRAEDPMLAFIQKRKVKSQGPAKPRYKGPPPPPNRFSIWPGYRWDGVDRSNGFEKKRFTAISNSKTREIEAFKWSTEEM